MRRDADPKLNGGRNAVTQIQKNTPTAALGHRIRAGGADSMMKYLRRQVDETCAAWALLIFSVYYFVRC